jgi:hypothetical protein
MREYMSVSVRNLCVKLIMRANTYKVGLIKECLKHGAVKKKNATR